MSGVLEPQQHAASDRHELQQAKALIGEADLERPLKQPVNSQSERPGQNESDTSASASVAL